MNFKKWIVFCINLTLCCNSKCWHECIVFQQELIYFTFSRQGSGEHTVNLSLLLQRCNEVQLWVATEILLCSPLGKRVQLVKKFIKSAAQWVSSSKKCNSIPLPERESVFFAVMGWDWMWRDGIQKGNSGLSDQMIGKVCSEYFCLHLWNIYILKQMSQYQTIALCAEGKSRQCTRAPLCS